MPLPIFPALPGLAFPVTRRTLWDTIKNDSLSGKRVRFSNRSYPTYAYEVSFGDTGFLRSSAAFPEWQQLQGFVNRLVGGTALFLYDDVTDDAATAQPFGTGDGASTTFQLVRTLGGFTEPVFFPNVITGVTVDGVATGGFSLTSYGAIVFPSPPNAGAALAWSGTFYWGCRMDEDDHIFSNIMLNLFELKSLRFSTEKLP